MHTSLLQENIITALGLDELTVEEQSAFLSEVGDVVFQTSLVRLVSELSDEQQQALEAYIDTEPEPDVLLAHLLEHYEMFPKILQEAVLEFKEDALAVLEKSQTEDVAIAKE